MTTCVIGSMRDLTRINDIADQLKQQGRKVLTPLDASGGRLADSVRAKNEFMRGMYDQIKQCDAVLVVNDRLRNGLEGYIGPNTFLQLGMAMALGKTLYALAKWDEKLPYNDELVAMDINIIDVQRRF